jgi:hypothetical protein
MVFAAGAASGVTAYLTSRRSASGKVATSEASVLWHQAQDMRLMLLTEKQKAEEQRDKFIDSYTGQILPMLTSINNLVKDLSVAVADGVSMTRGISASLAVQGGEANADIPSPPAASLAEPGRR